MSLKFCFALAFVATACSGSESRGDDAHDDAGNGDNHDGGGAADTPDTGTTSTPVRCAEFFDMTANGADILFPGDAQPPQYTPNCVKIKVMQSVTFKGDFTLHPLEAHGGDADNPIPAVSTGKGANVRFTVAGTYGFQCSVHPSSMFGAIQVVP